MILSPAGEDPASLEATSRQLEEWGVRRLVDPETYVYAIEGGTAGRHESNGVAFSDLSWFVSPTEVSQHVAAIIALNDRLGVPEVVAPSPLLSSFTDTWAPVGIQYIRATSEAADGRRVWASVVAEDAAFSNWDEVAGWLDALTKVDVSGVYLVVAHSSSGGAYPTRWDAGRLTNVLRLIYWLSDINQYEVLWGYSDVPGLLGMAAGASGGATGWFHSQRCFSSQKWIPREGGRPANPRVLSGAMLSSLDATGEAIACLESSIAESLIPEESVRDRIRAGTWGLTESRQQHLDSMAVRYTNRAGFRSEWVDQTLDVIKEAIECTEVLRSEGVVIDTSHRSRLESYRDAVTLFADSEGISV